jgi:hypothetical protein
VFGEAQSLPSADFIERGSSVVATDVMGVSALRLIARERDHIAEAPAVHESIPQGNHLHALLLMSIVGRKRGRIESLQSRAGFKPQSQFEVTNLYFKEKYNGSTSCNSFSAAKMPPED